LVLFSQEIVLMIKYVLDPAAAAAGLLLNPVMDYFVICIVLINSGFYYSLLCFVSFQLRLLSFNRVKISIVQPFFCVYWWCIRSSICFWCWSTPVFRLWVRRCVAPSGSISSSCSSSDRFSCIDISKFLVSPWNTLTVWIR